MRALLLLALGLTIGCGGKSRCDMKGVGEGALDGTLNGDLWTSDNVRYGNTSLGVFVTAVTDGGHAVEVYASHDVNGDAVSQVIRDHDFPIEIEIDNETDGEAYFDNSTGNQMLSEPGGWITIDRISGGQLEGCVGFVASDAFDTFDLEADFKATLQ